MKLSEVLRARDVVVPEGRTKIVRHSEPRLDIEEIVRTSWIETYQQYQGDAVFDGCDVLLSFVGEPGNQSRFVGAYEVRGRRPARFVPPPEGLPNAEWVRGAKYWYDVRPREELSDLRHRLVIGWSGRIWHRWYTDFEVLEIRPRGRVLPPFRDYSAVHLSFRNLRELEANAIAHPDWVASLRAVGGVYLIVSSVTGAQYVGSATGGNGLWQRWTSYLAGGHGGNRRLRELCAADHRHPEAFSFSVLDTFSRTTSVLEARARESHFKAKLGSRAFGLNSN